MKRLLNRAIAFALVAMCAFPAQAATIESIAKVDARFRYDGKRLSMYIESANATNIPATVRDAVFAATRSCSGYEFTTASYCPETGEVSLGQSNVEKIVERTTWVEEWTKENVPNIVSNGMTKEAAQRTVFDYIANNYDYDFSLLRSNGASASDSKDSSDAYSLLCNKRGVCVAFSCAYRALLEAVPFENGVVNWNATNPEHIKVAIVENATHMWNAIQADDGTWHFYDTSSASCMRLYSAPKMMSRYYDFADGPTYDNHGDKIWHY